MLKCRDIWLSVPLQRGTGNERTCSITVTTPPWHNAWYNVIWRVFMPFVCLGRPFFLRLCLVQSTLIVNWVFRMSLNEFMKVFTKMPLTMRHSLCKTSYTFRALIYTIKRFVKCNFVIINCYLLLLHCSTQFFDFLKLLLLFDCFIKK